MSRNKTRGSSFHASRTCALVEEEEKKTLEGGGAAGVACQLL
jgi:hypothetical protein